MYTGSHSKTVMFGLIATDGRRIFRQHDRFEMHAFARFLKATVCKFEKIGPMADNTSRHRAKMTCQMADGADGWHYSFSQL